MNRTDRESADARPGMRGITRPLILFLVFSWIGAFACGAWASSGILLTRSGDKGAAAEGTESKSAPGGPPAQPVQESGQVGNESQGDHGWAPIQTVQGNDWRRAGKERSHLEITVFALEEAAYIIIVSVIVFSGAGARWWKAMAGRVRRAWLARTLYVGGVLIVLGLIGFPFDLWRYHIDRSYSLSNQTTVGWLGDYAIMGTTGFVIALPVLMGIYWLIKRKPRTWWRWASAAAVPLLALTLLAGPYYAYLFNSFVPLKNKQLAAEVLALAAKAGVNVSVVYETNMSRQTNAADAYVTGLGASKRIVLGDTLIQNFSEQEILFATAHEIGHYVMNHVLIGFLFAVLATTVFLFLVQRIGERAIARFGERIGVESAYDPPALLLGVLIALLLSLAGMPIFNGFSRYLEHRADEYAAQMTIPEIVSRQQAADAFERLGRLGLSDPDPSPIVEFIFWDHPALDEREKFVLNFRR